METISIGSSEAIDELRDRLDKEFLQLAKEGVAVTIHQVARGPWTFLGCNFETPPTAERHVASRQHIANALSDVIVNLWEERLLRKLVQHHYGYFDVQEQAGICEKARQALHGGDRPEVAQAVQTSRRTRVLARLQEYLERNDELVVDGFITFRLKDYMEELADAVDRAVDEYLLDKEYREFIRLLKYFVDMQEPRVDLAHVVMKADGHFQLLDGRGAVIDNTYLAQFVVETGEGDIDYEDLLISALITIAPRRIRIHNGAATSGQATVDTVVQVFGNRVELCHGCSRCVT